MNDRHLMVNICSLNPGVFFGGKWCSYTLLCVDSTRTTRSVEYRDPEDVWKYTGGGKRLPSAPHYNSLSINNNSLSSSILG